MNSAFHRRKPQYHRIFVESSRPYFEIFGLTHKNRTRAPSSVALENMVPNFVRPPYDAETTNMFTRVQRGARRPTCDAEATPHPHRKKVLKTLTRLRPETVFLQSQCQRALTGTVGKVAIVRGRTLAPFHPCADVTVPLYRISTVVQNVFFACVRIGHRHRTRQDTYQSSAPTAAGSSVLQSTHVISLKERKGQVGAPHRPLGREGDALAALA